MWIPETISQGAGGAQAFTADVAFSNGREVRFSDSQRSGVQFLPYGFESVVPKGERAAVVNAGRTLCAVGVQSPASNDLEPGEIRLCSMGGASIVLKNDGRVLINGIEFQGG